MLVDFGATPTGAASVGFQRSRPHGDAVGLWTKADSIITHFDTIAITPLE